MPIVSVRDVSNKPFDYIIVGGGTAGLCLAARLSENPEISIVVLEAGEANLNDPCILRPGQYTSHFGQKKYEWGFETTPQKNASNNKYGWQRGKGLGGSSGINFMCWTKPPAEDIDDWEKLGNPGWNWKSYQQYSLKTEKFVKPTPEAQAAHNLKSVGWTTATEGSLITTYPAKILDLEVKAQQTLVNMGLPVAPDPVGGNPRGVYFVPNTIDPASYTRSYSTTAFYLPYADRSNYLVVVSAYANRILTNDGVGDVIATGVEFEHEGEDYVVHAQKEVILCAGALKSPQLLELSGIGKKDVLEAIGVPLKVELNGVGENVQEHIYVGSSFELAEDFPDETYDVLSDPEVAVKNIGLLDQGAGVFSMGIVGFAFVPLQMLSERADAIHKAAKEKILKNKGSYPPGLFEQYKIQLERLEKGGIGCELITFPGVLSAPNAGLPGKKYFSVLAALNHNFSRGTIHSISSDSKVNPAFDPHYFEEDVDLEIFLEMVKFIRKVPENAPLKTFTSSTELNPGPEVKTDDQIRDWIKKCMRTTYHTAGSASMLPREKGGVVDPNLRVYGTANIRVVDLSVVPLHFASHPQASVYCIAEKAAAIIKERV